MPRGIFPTTLGPRRLAALIATCIAFLAAGPARADLVISAGNVIVSAGDTSVGLDVTLTNTGPSASVPIGGFSFELTVGGTDISFTGVTTATALAPYIFDGLGVNGSNIGIPVTDQDILASDNFSIIGSGTTLGSGVTVGLGHLVFDVSTNATGIYSIILRGFPATSLSDPDGNDVEITSLVNGSVAVRSIPEPSAMLLIGIGGGMLFVRRYRNGATRRAATDA